MFKFSIKHVAQLLYLGQKERAIQYGTLLTEKLYGKHYDGGTSIPIHPWFMLELFCKWQNITLDREALRYPEDLGVYNKALKIWDNTDTAFVSEIIDELTHFHIQQSDEYEQKGENTDLDFMRADYFIFPVEILMWLAIRRDLGLPEYKPSAKNELMQLEINKLPTTITPAPEDKLVEQCKAKLLKENPNITFDL